MNQHKTKGKYGLAFRVGHFNSPSSANVNRVRKSTRSQMNSKGQIMRDVALAER